MNAVNVVVPLLVISSVVYRISGLELSLIHINDFHARFEEVDPHTAGPCKSSDCVGGFSRIYTAVNRSFSQRPNPIVLVAGDNFQGTVWYNYFKWNVTQRILNLLPIDAMTVGNHEFDDGIKGLAPFLRAVKAPVVVSNINDTLEPELQGLYKKSVVIQREGKKIGLIGVVTSSANLVSNTEKLILLDESDSVNAEAQRLRLTEGVFTNIIISHCGYEFDLEIARKATSGISVIVGGHSHTLLYNGVPPAGASLGPYPTVVKSVSNETVLVVQADAFSRYLGNLTVELDQYGQPVFWEGNPIYLDRSIPQNEYVNGILNSYRAEIEKLGNRILGRTNVTLDQMSCSYSECNFGNLITDSMMSYYSDQNMPTSIAFINSGAIRININIGDITVNDLKTALPFGETLDRGYLKGKHLKSVMEVTAAAKHFRKISFEINLVQISGASVVMDISKPVGSRVVSLKIRCQDCEKETFEDILEEEYYPVALTSFVARGGDGLPIKDNLVNHTKGPALEDVLERYITKMSPLTIDKDGRITVKGGS